MLNRSSIAFKSREIIIISKTSIHAYLYACFMLGLYSSMLQVT